MKLREEKKEEKKEERESDMESSVDIIASGYEFICPKCEAYNKIIQTATEVECGSCLKAFSVSEIEHAIGGGLERGKVQDIHNLVS